MPDTSLLVGSITLPEQVVEINASAQTITAGTRYLRHPTAALSWLAQLEAAITAAGIGSASVVMLQSLRVRASGSPNFDIDWTSSGATLLRDLLGWAANSASAGTHTATSASPLIWDPGDPATPSVRFGATGYTNNDDARHVSADGTQFRVDIYHEQKRIELSWTNVAADRLQVDDATQGGGTFHEFYEQSGKRGYSMFWHAAQSLDGTATPVTWDDVQRFGPYAIRPEFGVDWYARNVPNAEIDGPLEIPLMQLAEYS